MNPENLNVSVNSIIVSEKVYEYNSDIGSFTVEISLVSVFFV